jgi:hypothetical protein
VIYIPALQLNVGTNFSLQRAIADNDYRDTGHDCLARRRHRDPNDRGSDTNLRHAAPIDAGDTHNRAALAPMCRVPTHVGDDASSNNR